MARKDHTRPLLDRLPRTDPFMVPDGFFERFPHHVQVALPRGRRSRAWANWMRPVLAASLVLVAVTLLLLRQWTTTPTPDMAMVSIPSEEVLADEFRDELEYHADLELSLADLSEAELAAWLERDPQQLDELLNLDLCAPC
ncbi:MAG: hypothetical protein JNM31_13495 [Flavobacteriales bacterium]|nr:hypothetical protein [Flavobacteriales bacterium]